MGLPYIRETYGVPAKRGGRIRYTDTRGTIFHCTITSALNQYLRVRVDDRAPGRRATLILHPTWQIEYLPHTPERKTP